MTLYYGEGDRILETHVWTADIKNPEEDIIKQAGEVIKKGGLVAFPTETVYGLGANGLCGDAVKKIFIAKGRPSDNPLILHIAKPEEIIGLASFVPLKAQILMEKFWPGPLTMVLPKRDCIPWEITAGLETVAIRMPANPIALALIEESGCPIAAPSANRSGYPSPTTAKHVLDDLEGRVEVIIDGGQTGVGLESTVLDMTKETPIILRPGGVTREDLQKVIGQVEVDPGLSDAKSIPLSPGMKYTHYSPRAEVILLQGDMKKKAEKIKELITKFNEQKKKVGVLISQETAKNLKNIDTHYMNILGSQDDMEIIARNIYYELRNCDRVGVDIILTETYLEEGIGAALMNRLLKSAGNTIVRA